MKVRVFSTSVCPYCHKVKEWLKDKGIRFEDINVAENKKAAREMVEKSGQMGVPVTEVIGDNGKSEMIIGFDEEKLKKALKLEGG